MAEYIGIDPVLLGFVEWNEGNLYPQPGSDSAAFDMTISQLMCPGFEFEGSPCYCPVLLRYSSTIFGVTSRSKQSGERLPDRPALRAPHLRPARSMLYGQGQLPTVTGDGFFGDVLLDLRVGLPRLGALAPGDAESKHQDCIATTRSTSVAGAGEFGVRLVPSRRD